MEFRGLFLRGNWEEYTSKCFLRNLIFSKYEGMAMELKKQKNSLIY